MKQIFLTVAMGKRLIGKALTVHPAVIEALKNGTIVIIAGTTNGYVAEEILNSNGLNNNFSRRRFIRGVNLPPGYKVSNTGRLADESKFPGDVVITKGVLKLGKTIDEVVSDLKEGDIIIKGANALDLIHKRAAILIGNPQGGTIVAALPAVIGRRVRLLIPVGLEKRIPGDLDMLASEINSPGAGGYRLLPVNGEVVTEIEALALLTGTKAEMIAAGGVSGAEGGVLLGLTGSPEQIEASVKLVQSVASEPPFIV